MQSDIINALWETADMDSREGTTFVDVVDFCFNCVLFLEREKQASGSSIERTSRQHAPQFVALVSYLFVLIKMWTREQDTVVPPAACLTEGFPMFLVFYSRVGNPIICVIEVCVCVI